VERWLLPELVRHNGAFIPFTNANWNTVLQGVSAQGVAGTYTDADTGIIFATQTIPDGNPSQGLTTGGFTVGLALPANAATVDATEYIGMIVSYSPQKSTGDPI
jgi:hypothetical protein